MHLAMPRRGRVSFVIALVGMLIAAYLTYEHYTASSTLACPENKAFNCAKVTTSEYSHIGPLPVALMGLLYFAVMVVLCSPWLWERTELDVVRIVGAVAGVGMVLYLVWAELFRIDAICLWCTAVHVCTLALLTSVLWTAQST